MSYEEILNGIMKYNASPEEACRAQLSVDPVEIKENVIMAPFWEPSLFSDAWTNVTAVAKGTVWNIKTSEVEFTYIKTGIGAPLMGDRTLLLGVTSCRQAIFIGSAGALQKDMEIGDLIVPQSSVCGDGYTRYLSSEKLKDNDCFGEKVYPDDVLSKKIHGEVKQISESKGINYHVGQVFCSDSIAAQFAHLDEIISYDCNCIEMETAAFFKAAKLSGIKAGAVLQVSDNTLINKSLYSGRTEENQKHRKAVRREIFPTLIEKLFSA